MELLAKQSSDSLNPPNVITRLVKSPSRLVNNKMCKWWHVSKQKNSRDVRQLGENEGREKLKERRR